MVYYLIIINVIAFIIMAIDKFKAIRNKWRIPEKVLFGLAIILGSLGIYAGMYVFSHKTKHSSFTIGIPAIIIIQIIIFILIFTKRG